VECFCRAGARRRKVNSASPRELCGAMGFCKLYWIREARTMCQTPAGDIQRSKRQAVHWRKGLRRLYVNCRHFQRRLQRSQDGVSGLGQRSDLCCSGLSRGQCFQIKMVDWLLLQPLRRRTRTGAVNRWIAKEACFYSAAVVRGAIEVRARRPGLVDGLR